MVFWAYFFHSWKLCFCELGLKTNRCVCNQEICENKVNQYKRIICDLRTIKLFLVSGLVLFCGCTSEAIPPQKKQTDFSETTDEFLMGRKQLSNSSRLAFGYLTPKRILNYY